MRLKNILISFLSCITLGLQASEKPNIIFLFSDDQSYLAMGCMGNDEIKTPNMDKLGQDGIIFDRHYNTTAICMASRANTMTGMLEYKAGCNFTHGSMTSAIFSKSYPVLLREAGYYTGFAGKFGFPVTAQATESIKHHSYDLLPVDQFDDWAGGTDQTKYATAENKYIAQYADRYPHATRAYGAWAGDFMKRAKDSGKPFNMSLYFKAPHLPHIPDPYFDKLYEGITFSKPSNFGKSNGAHLAQQPKLGRQYLSYEKKYKYFGDNYNQVKRDYYQLISGVDYAIGMIRKELVKQGLADNTVIILSSDNGYSEGVHGFSGKCLPYEEPSRAPLIIFDPRNPKNGRRVNTITAGIDLAPTMLKMAGLAIPTNMDGVDLQPLLTDQKSKVHDFLPLMQLFGSAPTQSLAVVTDEWKYIYWGFEDGEVKATEELFHLSKDSLEMTNLAQNPEYEAKLNEMRQKYDAQLTHWKATAVDYNDYQNYATIFDRTVSWQDKKDLYAKASMSTYQKEISGDTKKSKKSKKGKKTKKSKKK